MQREFEKRADPKDKNAQALLEEMRAHIKKVGELVQSDIGNSCLQLVCIQAVDGICQSRQHSASVWLIMLKASYTYPFLCSMAACCGAMVWLG